MKNSNVPPTVSLRIVTVILGLSVCTIGCDTSQPINDSPKESDDLLYPNGDQDNYDGREDPNADMDSNANSDADADSDTDSDTDTDFDSETVAISDRDTETETVSDTQTESDVCQYSCEADCVSSGGTLIEGYCGDGLGCCKESGTDTGNDTSSETEVDPFSALAEGPDGLFLNNNVAIVGDSIFDLSDDIRTNLEDLSGERYRYYPLSGAQMVGGTITPIPDQYQEAISDGPLRTVILDGGGNDILIGGQLTCRVYSDACEDILVETTEAGIELMNDMAADGVENVIWLGYYYTNGLIAGSDGFREALDVGMENAETECERSNLNCHFVDPRPEFDGQSGLIELDGIHPTAAGSDILADLIWDMMVEQNIEQNPH